jgi:hypothetical protein
VILHELWRQIKNFHADRTLTSKRTDQPIGLMALIQELNLPVRRPDCRLSHTKRPTVSELMDEEISAIKEAVASLSQDGPSS